VNDPPSTECPVFANRSPLDWFAWCGHLIAFAARVAPRAVSAVVRPEWWLRPFYATVVGATPLAAVAGVALGVVIWVHTRDVLDRAAPGAVAFLPTFLAAAVLLELAPVSDWVYLQGREYRKRRGQREPDSPYDDDDYETETENEEPRDDTPDANLRKTRPAKS